MHITNVDNITCRIFCIKMDYEVFNGQTELLQRQRPNFLKTFHLQQFSFEILVDLVLVRLY
jgi:hypothetical protein